MDVQDDSRHEAGPGLSLNEETDMKNTRALMAALDLDPECQRGILGDTAARIFGLCAQ